MTEMKAFTAGIILTLGICVAEGDIPDCTIEWDRLSILQHPGHDRLLDCTVSEDGSLLTCVGYTDVEEGRDFWIMRMDTTGAVIWTQAIFQDLFGLVGWAQTTFINENRLAIIRCSAERGVPPDLCIIDISRPEEQHVVNLSALCMGNQLFRISALEYVSVDRFLLAGTSWSPETGKSLYTAMIDPEGMVLWRSFVFESSRMDIDWLTLEHLNEGCVFTFSEDCFPSDLPVQRLNAWGEKAWDTFIEVDCEFLVDIHNFQQLDDGSVLCVGTSDRMNQMACRGFIACLGTSGEELWRREDWYNDHTSWWDVRQLPDGRNLLVGWTGTMGSPDFTVEDRNILLAVLDESATSLRGIELAVPGNQLPQHIFLRNSGEIFVIGTSTSEKEQEANIFLGRTRLTELE